VDFRQISASVVRHVADSVQETGVQTETREWQALCLQSRGDVWRQAKEEGSRDFS
jgi:hypothetical protein